jgi:hypothetical protein
MKAPLLVLVALAIASRADGQLRRPVDERRSESGRTAISVLAGPSPYDLAGTGTGFAAAVRVDVPSGRILIIEPGVGFFRYRNDADRTVSYILPELSLQVQVPSRVVRPYAGAGVGFAEFLSGRGTTFATLHAAGGVRIDLGSVWGIRGEVRLRAIDPFKGNTTDLTAGITRKLGRR